MRKNGEHFQADIRTIPFMHRGERHVLTVARDITERREREQALRTSEEQYRAVFNATTDGLVLRDFFKRTGQPLNQPWLVAMVLGLVKRFPLAYLIKLGIATIRPDRTRGWGRARDAINEYAEEVEAQNRKALGLGAKGAK